MKTRTKALIGAALAATALAAAPVSARGELPHDRELPLPTPVGGCYAGGGGFSIQIGGGFRGIDSRFHNPSYGRHSGYRSSQSVGYSKRCRIIDRYYYCRGYQRYCRITYLHEAVDCYGRVLRCWKSHRTIRL